MKKFLFLMLTVFAMSMTANAQRISENERERVINNLIDHMQKWGDWYITVTPVTWYEYWAVTGIKKHPKNVSVSKAAIVQSTDQQRFCDVLNKEAKRKIFILLSKTEAAKAHRDRVHLHDDISYNSYDHGFYVKMSKYYYQQLRE